MKDKTIKLLAQSCVNNPKLTEKTTAFILKGLTKRELKVFLNCYKIALNKKRIYITASSQLDKTALSLLKNTYKNYELEFTYDKDLGAGIKIQQNDMIIDYTFKKYISDTISQLK